MALESYRDLEVWQKAIQLIVESYRRTDSFPKDERFGLTAQIRRAAIAVAANIAEGHERRHLGDYLRHVSHSRGSIAELETELIVAERLSFARRRDLASLYLLCDDISRMLTGLRRSLEANRPSTHHAPRTTHR
jgi:four helix bundle protein